MRGQLLPLRRLLTSSGVLRSISGTLPLPPQDPPLLNYLACDPTSRAFSTFPSRSRNGSRGGGGPRNQREADNPRGQQRGDIPRDQRNGGFLASAATGRAKSLIEDEAELSDWVSDLKTDSFRLQLSSNSDEESDLDRPRRGRGGDRDRDMDRGRGREREPPRSARGRLPARRQRDDDSDEFLEASDRRTRNSRGSNSKFRVASGSEESEEEEDAFSRRPSREQGRNRGGSSLESSWRGGRGADLNRGGGRGGRAPGGRDAELSHGGGRGGRAPGGRDADLNHVRGRGGRAPRGRDVDFNHGRGRGGRAPVPATLGDKEDDSDEDDEPMCGLGLDDDFFGDKDDEQKGAVDEYEGDSSSESAEGDSEEAAPMNSVKNEYERDSSSESAEGDSEEAAPRNSAGGTDSYLSQTRFDQCSLSSLSLKGIKAAGYERMTVVQEATLPLILKGKDVLAKAKTGTGKTVAFLLPSIEAVAKLPPVDRDQRKPPINVLVICPTRELAAQAAAEADTLLKYHPSIGCQVVTGGTRLALEQKRMQANSCQIIVATPGRLRDHIENTPGFATRLMGVKVLVLDEADRLLDMGFRKDIEKIVAAVPKQRQTLLFSATVPEEVRQVCYIALKRDHEFVNTVEEGSEETHSQVRQMHLVAPLEKQFSILYSVLTEHISEDVDYKVIVFCTTAMVTRLVADLLSELKLNVREIHSRKPQTYRTRISKEFRESKGLILVSSDVSARGIDYPDVTFVIQLGVPADREQYIHRLGRTGRQGKEGTGILMLAPWEEFFLDSIKNLPITKAPLPSSDPDTRKKVERALAHIEMKNKESAYQAWLGYYNSNRKIGGDKCRLVVLANEFSRSMGLDNPPAIAKLVIRKMGLNNVPGLRVK